GAAQAHGARRVYTSVLQKTGIRI
ncbi:MAG: hypothetical protein UW74_C0051G0001, partial [Candidatus Giovannonibacteria bacterium GW2011_GWC2_44_8]